MDDFTKCLNCGDEALDKIGSCTSCINIWSCETEHSQELWSKWCERKQRERATCYLCAKTASKYKEICAKCFDVFMSDAHPRETFRRFADRINIGKTIKFF